MAISLINNTSSLDSQSRLATNASKLNNTIQRLSSGLRINSSGDDAAGLAIANVFRSDISKLRQGIRNANDGVSQLQIVDGGLNTISGLLDRAGVLASQSASETFSGNRGTLQAELDKVMAEVTRQAQVIGLGGEAGTDAGRFNKLTSVFIGGGSSAAQNEIGIDLTNSRVDKVGLNLNSVNIGEGTGNVTGAQNISAGITAAETLSFSYVGSSGALSSFSVALSAGSASNAIDAINNNAEVQAAGVKASLNTSGNLVLSSAKFFTVSSSLASAAGQTGVSAAIGDVAVSSAATSVTKAITAGAGAATNQKLSFTGEQIGFANAAKDVSFAAFTTVSATNTKTITDAVNNDTDLRAAGVFAVSTKADGSEVKLVSLKSFNLAVTSDTGAVAANTNIDALQTATAATAGTPTGGAAGAKAALVNIKDAIAKLGQVQGKVGAGQNNLAQAIDLATTQITNFQAAESRIRDADVASEASDLARLTTLQQAGVAALAQANQSSQAVLSLLR